MPDEWEVPAPDDDDEHPFFDKQALAAVIAKAVDVLRPVGLTVIEQDVAAGIQQGQMILMLPCFVRASAKADADADIDARKQFNQMMAANHDAHIEELKGEVTSALSDMDDFLFGETESCTHESKHPDGFCLDCGKGLEDEGGVGVA